MRNIHVICVGKLKEAFYQEAVTEYSKRIGPFCGLTVDEIAEQRLPEKPSAAQREAALAREAAAMIARLPRSGAVIALCIEGEPYSSEALAQKLAAMAFDGISRVTFLIGGSHGLHASVKARADLCLSMSKMTFPHHLARVMLLEQIYRVFQILGGTQYHK